MKRPPPSLRARALAWLAQREHSRAELRGKLLRAARAAQQCESVDAVDQASAPGGDAVEAGANAGHPAVEAQVEQVLDALQAAGLLNEQRFIESRLRVRAAGHGERRIEHELARHGLKLAEAQRQGLRDSELQRAAELWRRRFGHAAADERERARQARFLAGRGFSGDVIRRVLAHGGAASQDEVAPDPD